MGLKAALTELDNAVKDLTSLHVQTYSGEVNSSIIDGSQSYDDIRKLVQTAASDSKITLVAETLAQFDGDSYNFIKQELDDIPKLALEVHKNAVKSGVDTRLGLLTLFKGLFDK